MKLFLISLILISLLVISSQAKDKPKKKTWMGVNFCSVKVLSNTKYSEADRKIVTDNCESDNSKLQKSSSCQNFSKKMAKNVDRLYEPVPSGALSDWRSCYKKCKNIKAVKNGEQTQEIAQALIDCSSSILSLSLLILSVFASLLL